MKIIKVYLVLVLGILIGINSYAAIVSDNDGAAFITKAEYDSLKSTFQSQLNEFNEGIDNKIENAISSYLAGISTARTLIIKTPVTNYADMRWKRKWDVYGTYVTWTGPTTWTRTTDKWFEPFMDKFIATRNPYLNIKFMGGRFTGYHIYYIYGDFDYDNADGPIYYSAGDSAVIKPSHNEIACEYDKEMDKLIVYNDSPFFTMGPMWDRHGSAFSIENLYESYNNGATWSAKKTSSETANAQSPMPATHPYAANWMVNNGANTSNREVFNATFVARYYNNANYLCKWDCIRHDWELAFTECYGYTRNWHPGNARGTVNIKTGSVMDIDSTRASNKLWSENPNGLHSCQLDQEAKQQEDFTYMMLGSDSTKRININRKHEYRTVGSNDSNDVKNELSEWCTVPVKFSRFAVSAMYPWTLDDENNGQVTYTNPVIVDLKVPFQEVATLSEISSGKFYNGKTPLSYGEGLPISTKLLNKGEITIEFDYEISKSIGTIPSGATGIQVDLKKTSYLTKKDDYFYGKVGSSTTRAKIKDSSIDTTAKHAKIVIAQNDVSDVDGLWMRIKPKSTESGLKAQIKNLDVKMVIE